MTIRKRGYDPVAMPLRPTTIRFAPDAMKIVTSAAEDMGISVSQFVREAALIRAFLVLRGHPDVAALIALSDEIRQLSRRDD